MKLLAKDPTIIQDIKAINEPLGAKLEEFHHKLLDNERVNRRDRGIEM